MTPPTITEAAWNLMLAVTQQRSCVCNYTPEDKLPCDTCKTAQKIQLAINNATAADKAEVERLKGKVALITTDRDLWKKSESECCTANLDLEKENTTLRTQLTEKNAAIEKLKSELDWQNNRNAGHPTKGGFEFYINEEWSGLATEAIDTEVGWSASLRKVRTDPDDERVRVRRVIEDDAILSQLTEKDAEISKLKSERESAAQAAFEEVCNRDAEIARLTKALNDYSNAEILGETERCELEKIRDQFNKHSVELFGREGVGYDDGLREIQRLKAEVVLRGHQLLTAEHSANVRGAALEFIRNKAVFPLGTIPERPWAVVDQAIATTPTSDSLSVVREALNKIASWGEGPEVTTAFDEPHSAEIAREALTLSLLGQRKDEK